MDKVKKNIEDGQLELYVAGVLPEEDMVAIVNFIDEAIQNADNEEALHEIGERVSNMMSARRLFVM